MAPTGSGKTAVALLGILQAFARGQRAIYTSPIKALSNQVPPATRRGRRFPKKPSPS
jgi:superfamily II RNA helicase